VRVLRFITNTRIEEGILSRAAYKNDLDNKIIDAGMFNNNATDQERREKLEDLIKMKNDE
jgi:SNF2 family DNA or RNA helicase